MFVSILGLIIRLTTIGFNSDSCHKDLVDGNEIQFSSNVVGKSSCLLHEYLVVVLSKSDMIKLFADQHCTFSDLAWLLRGGFNRIFNKWEHGQIV